MYLLNAFSANMLADFPTHVQFQQISVETARQLLTAATDAVSAVGHADTASVFQDQLKVPVAAQRLTVSLAPGSQAIVGQYSGPRLPEGATRLPEGATIKWLHVTVDTCRAAAAKQKAANEAAKKAAADHFRRHYVKKRPLRRLEPAVKRDLPHYRLM